MTQEIYIEDLTKVLKNKSHLERELKIKLTNKGKIVFINGKPEDEYLALKVLEAMDLGFSPEKALLLKNEEMILNIIPIKKVTKRQDLERIKARIIGTHGKTISNLSRLSECYLAIRDNKVGIIGEVGYLDEAILAINSLIHGSKQGSVYSRLEKEGKKRREGPENLSAIKNRLERKK